MGRHTTKVEPKKGDKKVNYKVSKDKVKKESPKASARGKAVSRSPRFDNSFATLKELKHETCSDADGDLVPIKEDLDFAGESEWSAIENDTKYDRVTPKSDSKVQIKKDSKQEDSPTTDFSHNGRVNGRKLVMWHRPRMIEKLFYHIIYESHRAGIELPWGAAVHRLSPGSSGQSAQQHLARFRDQLVAEGHLVPPLLGKRNIKQDPNIRGHIRDFTSEYPYAVRIVDWDEKIEDPKESLPIDDGIIRGSGKYKRGNYTGVTAHEIRKADGRRNRNPSVHQNRNQINSSNNLGEDNDELEHAITTSNYQEKKYNLRQTSKSYHENSEEEASESEPELASPDEIELEDESNQVGVPENLIYPPRQPSLTPSLVYAESEAGSTAGHSISTYDEDCIDTIPYQGGISENEWDSSETSDMDVLEHALMVPSYYEPHPSNLEMAHMLHTYTDDLQEYMPRMSYGMQTTSSILTDGRVHLPSVGGNALGLYNPYQLPQSVQSYSGIESRYYSNEGIFSEGFLFDENQDLDTAVYDQANFRTTDIGFECSPVNDSGLVMVQQRPTSKYQETPSNQFALVGDSFEYRSTSSDDAAHKDDEGVDDIEVYHF
ncbi:hypothetical protein B7463_g2931, partial [Scytalidium lignicola]